MRLIQGLAKAVDQIRDATSPARNPVPNGHAGLFFYYFFPFENATQHEAVND